LSVIERKRHKEAAHENHERWLVSYADFITLLFAFFVVMFASSQTDKSRAKQISDSIEAALKDGKSISMAPRVLRILGGTVDDKGQGNAQMKGPGGAQKAAKEAQEEQVVELTPSLKQLTSQLKAEIDAGMVEISMEPRGLVVSLKQTAFFPSGADVIPASSYGPLGKVASGLNMVPNPLRIEGHTDAQPIHSSRFNSNWELSAARSIAMMHLMVTKFGVAEQRMAITGFADTMPEAPNDTVEGRAKNRRVDIVIMNQLALAPKKDKDGAAAKSAASTEKKK
jgi:chemotaxis protein MotB